MRSISALATTGTCGHRARRVARSRPTIRSVAKPPLVPLPMKKPSPLVRRDFLKSSAAVGAGLLILPSGVLRGATAPSNKLNIALIGAGGRGQAHWNVLAEENVVALCDVDAVALAEAAARFPGAKTHVDWRRCLEQRDIDAVVICTPDHTHAMISIWAMNRGKHVFCEKPLGNSVAEARAVREVYLKNRNRLAVQMGTQRHANDNFRRIREMIRDGAIGELREARAWGNRQLPRPGYLPAAGPAPSTLDWDLWLGPSPEHPYNPGYFGARPGNNCLNWNMYWDFGSGQVGDMGTHTMDLVWSVIDATHPTSVEAGGDPFNPEVTPVKLTAAWDHPANDWRGPVRVMWYQGGALPPPPQPFLDLNTIGHGAFFKGDKGFLVADFNNRLLLPYGRDADLTYYRPRPASELTPSIPHFQREWINAAKGDLKTSCNFDYSGLMVEQLMLGLVAYRAGRKLAYDGRTGLTDDAEANTHLARPYRKGWVMNG